MNSLSQKIMKYGSYFLVFLVPLVFFSHWVYAYASSKTFFIYAITEVVFFCWIYTIITDRSYRLSKKILIYFLPLIGFVFWMTLSSIFAINPSLSFWSSLGRGTGLLTLYHCLALSFVIASIVKKNGINYIESLFQWFIAGSFVLGLSVWMGSEGLRFSGKVFEFDGGGGLVGNSTVASTYFLFTLAMSAFLFNLKSISTNKKVWFSIVGIIILFSPVFFSLHSLFAGHGILGSARGTILALLTGVGVTGLGYMFFSKNKNKRGFSIAIFSVGIIIFGFLWGQLMTPNTSIHNKFAEQARGSRFIFWDIANKSMNENPILGYGPENFSLAFQTHFDPKILLASNSFEGWADRAHNIYFDTGVAGGYPAIILYALFLLSLFYSTYKLEKNGKINRMQASLLFGLFVAYVINNLFTFDSTISFVALFVLAGILYSLDSYENKHKVSPVNINKSNKNIIAVVLGIIFVISYIYFVYMPSVKTKQYAEAFATVISKHPEAYPLLLEGSRVGEQWDISGLAFDKYRGYVENPALFKNDKEKSAYIINDLNAILKHLYTVSETNKTDYRLYISIAFLENTLTYMSDRKATPEITERVLSVLEKAKELSPTNPNVYWAIAQTKVWSGDFKGAEEAYRQAIEIAPMLPGSYNLLLRYAQALGNQNLFNDTLTEAQSNIPGYVFKN